MNASPSSWIQGWLAGLCLLAAMGNVSVRAQSSTPSNNFTNPPIVLTVEGTNVWIQPFQTNEWIDAYPNQVLKVRDRGRTGPESRTAIRLSDLSILRIGWHSEFVIQPIPEPETESEFNLFKGILRLFNRDRPGRHRFVTPTATAATRGTEFVLKVEEGTGRTTLTVFEGEAEMTNDFGAIRLANGEQGVAEAGQAPVRTAVIDATAIVQWCLYYPGVLDLAELELTDVQRNALESSLEAYRRSDLLRALSLYPSDRVPESDAERIYLAAIQLSVGRVEESEALLTLIEERGEGTSRGRRLADALRLMVDAVNLRDRGELSDQPASAPLATELLAESYFLQSQNRLSGALEKARRSVAVSPRFAFGWARVAELEFSRGRIGSSIKALDRSLTLAPRNAQALALRGFLLSAENRIGEAIDHFDRAIAIDGGLGNAWLGRGLCRIRQGDAEAGRFDLQMAASLEPQRSLLRSYLGKAFSNAGNDRLAMKELGLAKDLDSEDPTPWLYSALLLRDQNRINESVKDLERSQELNDNRRVYRSRLLLDQDRAVRGANLANVYRDAGMIEVSTREAARAVNADYANYSAHLFLANSFNQLRDLNQINLRYETAWFTEYLLANLLAPVGAGTLSQSVSQQEYSKLFEQDGLGLSSRTDYFSGGEWIQSAVQHGTFGNMGYAAEMFYHSDNGNRPNNDLEQFAAVLNFKHQLTPQDNLYVRLNYYDSDYGDVNHYYDPADANPGLRVREDYAPSVLAGYHHEWSPGHHTLFLGGRLDQSFEVDNPSQGSLYLDRGSGTNIVAVAPLLSDQRYRSGLELYLAELQQIWQQGDHTFVLGGRYQFGDLEIRNEQSNSRLSSGLPVNVALTNYVDPSFDRQSVYLYDHWQLHPDFLIAAGVSYDWLTIPENFRYAPVSNARQGVDQLSPKAGFIWTPMDGTAVRAAWFQGLGGVTLDQSVRLEPSQVAGFNQAYRSLIPESVSGANAAPEFETWSVSLEQKFGNGTFVALAGDLLYSDVERQIGVVDFSQTTGPVPSQTSERLDYRERNVSLTVNQLLDDAWSIGAQYRFSVAELDDTFGEIPGSAISVGGFQRQQNLEALLHQGRFFTLFNHPSGFFARADAVWTAQDNDGYTPARPGSDFWQFHLEAGYRFHNRRAEIRLGVLNLTDQDYRLNPLNLTQNLPRERTFAASVQFHF